MFAPFTIRVPVHSRAYTNSRYGFQRLEIFDTVAFPEAPRMAGTTQELKDLANLFREGLLTREEFDQQKQQLLAGSSSGKATGTSSPNVGDSVGAYRILGDLGRGGMGVVYRGKHRTAAIAKRQGGEVAIKVLHSQYAQDEAFRDRFEREASMGLKLDHPGIVKVHDLVIDGGNLALVMDLAEGRPLSEVIGKETGPIPWERAWPMFKQMLEAVAYAHEHNVVHRDIKPENVIVSPSGQLKVLDFGIAKDMEGGKTKTGTGMGTVDYMAPEQYTDAKSVDQRADIYALGMTLYEMLAGRLPWESSATEFQVMTVKSRGDFPPPTDFYPEIPERIVQVVKSATAVKPAKRIKSVAAFVSALESDGETIDLKAQAGNFVDDADSSYRLKPGDLTDPNSDYSAVSKTLAQAPEMVGKDVEAPEVEKTYSWYSPVWMFMWQYIIVTWIWVGPFDTHDDLILIGLVVYLGLLIRIQIKTRKARLPAKSHRFLRALGIVVYACFLGLILAGFFEEISRERGFGDFVGGLFFVCNMWWLIQTLMWPTQARPVVSQNKAK
jgi:serine/threonine protein kinase